MTRYRIIKNDNQKYVAQVRKWGTWSSIGTGYNYTFIGCDHLFVENNTETLADKVINEYHAKNRKKRKNPIVIETYALD